MKILCVICELWLVEPRVFAGYVDYFCARCSLNNDQSIDTSLCRDLVSGLPSPIEENVGNPTYAFTVSPSQISKDSRVKSYLGSLEQGIVIRNVEDAVTTYSSEVNYRGDLDLPFQRWFNYKEGYSLGLNHALFQKFGLLDKERPLVVDPFCGSGSTLMAAGQLGIASVGFEVNPFSAFLAAQKTRNFADDVPSKLAREAASIRSFDWKMGEESSSRLPALGMADKVFSPDIWDELWQIKQTFIDCESDEELYSLKKLAWISVLEYHSNYKKAGNGLKKKVASKLSNRERPHHSIADALDRMSHDLLGREGFTPATIIPSSSLNYEKYISEPVDLVVFSPPYVNCFDYTEIYKIELWFGEFVRERGDLRRLRDESLRSHLNHSFLASEPLPEVEDVLRELEGVELWDKKIPFMVSSYFTEMASILEQIFSSLQVGGACVVVVSNSSYGGVVVPTDLILAQIGRRLGFDSAELEVARRIITSSQQFKETLEYSEYLRESIITLRKSK